MAKNESITAKLSPLERACRECCRAEGVSEDEWRLFENTISAARRAAGIAVIDLLKVARRERLHWFMLAMTPPVMLLGYLWEQW